VKLIKIKDAWVNPESIDAISPVYHGIPHVVVVVKGEPVGLLFNPEEDGSPAELAALIAERLQFADMDMDMDDSDSHAAMMRNVAMTDDQLDLVEQAARMFLSRSNGGAVPLTNLYVLLSEMFESLIPEVYAGIEGEYREKKERG
jgi:hypothetical protein